MIPRILMSETSIKCPLTHPSHIFSEAPSAHLPGLGLKRPSHGLGTSAREMITFVEWKVGTGSRLANPIVQEMEKPWGRVWVSMAWNMERLDNLMLFHGFPSFHLLMVWWSLCVSLYRSFFSAPQFSSESPWLCGHLGGSLLSKVLLHLRASLQVTSGHPFYPVLSFSPCFFSLLTTSNGFVLHSTRSGNPASPNAASRKGIVSGTKTRPPTSPLVFNSISDHTLKTKPVDTRAVKEHLLAGLSALMLLFWHKQSCRMCSFKFQPA